MHESTCALTAIYSIAQALENAWSQTHVAAVAHTASWLSACYLQCPKANFIVVCVSDVSVLQTFGKLQSKLFPKYFALLSTSTAVCLGTIAFAPGSTLPRGQLISLGEILTV